VAVGDVNSDGHPDIVAENSFGQSVSVLDGNGDGTFGASTNYATASFPWALGLADLGHRGKLDIVTANFFGTVSVLVNNGDGTFAPRQTFLGGNSHQGHSDLALADFNGDGFLDVASANFNTPTVSIEFDQFSQVLLQLLGPDGTVLQTGAAGPTNLSLVLSDFIAPVTGTYYALLTGAGIPRSFDMVITRGADFDTHPNGSFATAQDITGTVGALGAIVATGSGTSTDWYRVTAQAGQTLFFDTTVPSSGPGQFTNNLQPHIELFNPSGTLVATGVLEADGRNETITFTVPVGAAGAYRVQVTGKNGTVGEYFLDPLESGGLHTAVLPPAGDSANTRSTLPPGVAGTSGVHMTGMSGIMAEFFLDPLESGGLNAAVFSSAGGLANAPGTILSASDEPFADGIAAASGAATEPAGQGESLSPRAIDQLFADAFDGDPSGDGSAGWLSVDGESE
jgi:hypothetical protein